MHVEATARKPGCARTLLAFGISAVKVMIARYEKEQKVVCARRWRGLGRPVSNWWEPEDFEA